MESKKRIRANLRLELESTAQEIKDLENNLKKNPDDEELKSKLEELQKYYEKLERQYEAISGIDVESASTLKPIKKMETKHASFLKRILLSVGALLLASGYYNMMLHALESKEIDSVILDISSGFLVANEDVLINSMLGELASQIIIGTIAGGTLLLVIGFLLENRTRQDLIETIAFVAVNSILVYSIVGDYLGYLKPSDVKWLYFENPLIVADVLILLGLIIFITAFSPRMVKDYFVLGWIEGLLVFIAGGLFVYGIYLGGTENIFYQWPNAFLLMFSAMIIRSLRSLLKINLE